MENITEDKKEDKIITCYSLILLKYDSEDFIHYFEEDINKLSIKTKIDIDLLNASLELGLKTLHRGFYDWTICNKEYSYILVTKQNYLNTHFEYAKQCYKDFIKDTFID